MNTTPSLWTRLKAKLAGLAKHPPITVVKPTGPWDGTSSVLSGCSDGIHPRYEFRERESKPPLTDDKIRELNEAFGFEQDEFMSTQLERELTYVMKDPKEYFDDMAARGRHVVDEMYPPVDLDIDKLMLEAKDDELDKGVHSTFALPPRQMGKTNMTHTRARAQGVPMAPIFDERLMVDSEAPLDMEELLKKYPFLYSAGEQERNEKFIQRFKDHFKEHPEAYANADSLEAIGALIEAKEDRPDDLVVIDSLAHLDDSRPVGIVVMGDRHPSMSRHLSLLSLAALSNAMSQRVGLSLDALSPSTDKMVEMLNNMEMCVEPAVVLDKPWIEMNQPYQRRKKRSRPGRKHKHEK